jgi:AraC-like DNA-binding protein
MPTFSFYEPLRDVAHNLDCNYRSLATSIAPHFHQAIEISCILSGEIDFTVGTKTQHVGVGDITFVPPYVVHSSSKSDLCDAAVLIIPRTFFADFESMMGDRSFAFLCDKEANTRILSLITELADRKKQGDTINEILLRSYADRVLGLIADAYTPEPLDRKQGNLIVSIISYIEEHCTEKLTLAAIASHFGYSKYHFSRLFHTTFHCSLPTYINAVRARRVAGCEGKKSDRILDAGFGSLSAYYRAKR